MSSSDPSLLDIEVLVEKIAALTGLSKTKISNQMATTNIKTFNFNNSILVSSKDFGCIIDAWAADIKANILGNDASVHQKPSTHSKKQKASKKPPAALTEDSLSWPKGFEAQVSHLYTPTLKKVLPQDPVQKQVYLEAIANDTPAGQSLIQDLVAAIVKKSTRTLSPDNVTAGLKTKCIEML